MIKKQICCGCAERIRDELIRQKQMILLCFAATFFWGMAAHAYGFFACNLSHDSLNAFVATAVEEDWKIALGRYVVPVYRAVFRNGVTLPWLIGLLGLFWTGIAVWLVVRLSGIESKVLMVLTAGVMVTNITCICQVASYLYEYDFNSFALMMAVLAVCLWKNGSGLVRLIAGGLCVLVSVGIYQAYLTVTVSLIIWVSILELFHEKDVKTVFKNGIQAIGMLLFGGILYFVIGEVLYDVTGITQQARTNVFAFSRDSNPILQYLNLILPTVTHLSDSIVHAAYASKAMEGAVTVISAISLIQAAAICIRKRYSADRVVLIVLLFLALPFAMNCIYILSRGKDVHELMIYGAWLFYIFTLQFFFQYSEGGLPKGWTSLAKAGGCVLVALMLWQNIVLANTAYVKKEREAEAALSTMTRAVAMMEQHEAYVFGETEVAFVGVCDVYGTMPGFESVSTITGLDSNNAIPIDAALYFYNAYEAYFDYVLNYDIRLCDDETHTELLYGEAVAAMPSFPDKGCVAMIDDVLVVKMGKPF